MLKAICSCTTVGNNALHFNFIKNNNSFPNKLIVLSAFCMSKEVDGTSFWNSQEIRMAEGCWVHGLPTTVRPTAHPLT